MKYAPPASIRLRCCSDTQIVYSRGNSPKTPKIRKYGATYAYGAYLVSHRCFLAVRSSAGPSSSVMSLQFLHVADELVPRVRAVLLALLDPLHGVADGGLHVTRLRALILRLELLGRVGEQLAHGRVVEEGVLVVHDRRVVVELRRRGQQSGAGEHLG